MNPNLRIPIGLLAAAVLGLTAAPAAEAKKRKSRSAATYMTTVKASMSERWDYRDYMSDTGPDGTDTREEKGAGTASAHFSTRRPFPLMAIKNPNGQPPTLNHGSDGIPMKGSWVRGGELSVTYDGTWDAANPDTTADTSGCGMRDERPFVTLGWSYDTPGHLQLIGLSEPLRERCPRGPMSGSYRWAGGDAPLVSEILAKAGRHKFLRVKQFTVRGSRTWTAAVDPRNDSGPGYTRQTSGTKTVTWQWEATFRLKGSRKKRR